VDAWHAEAYMSTEDAHVLNARESAEATEDSSSDASGQLPDVLAVETSAAASTRTKFADEFEGAGPAAPVETGQAFSTHDAASAAGSVVVEEILDAAAREATVSGIASSLEQGHATPAGIGDSTDADRDVDTADPCPVISTAISEDIANARREIGTATEMKAIAASAKPPVELQAQELLTEPAASPKGVSAADCDSPEALAHDMLAHLQVAQNLPPAEEGINGTSASEDSSSSAKHSPKQAERACKVASAELLCDEVLPDTVFGMPAQGDAQILPSAAAGVAVVASPAKDRPVSQQTADAASGTPAKILGRSRLGQPSPRGQSQANGLSVTDDDAKPAAEQATGHADVLHTDESAGPPDRSTDVVEAEQIHIAQPSLEPVSNAAGTADLTEAAHAAAEAQLGSAEVDLADADQRLARDIVPKDAANTAAQASLQKACPLAEAAQDVLAVSCQDIISDQPIRAPDQDSISGQPSSRQPYSVHAQDIVSRQPSSAILMAAEPDQDAVSGQPSFAPEDSPRVAAALLQAGSGITFRSSKPKRAAVDGRTNIATASQIVQSFSANAPKAEAPIAEGVTEPVKLPEPIRVSVAKHADEASEFCCQRSCLHASWMTF